MRFIKASYRSFANLNAINWTLLLLTALAFQSMALQPADANQCWRDKHGRLHCNSGLHRGHYKQYDRSRYYSGRQSAFFDPKTKKVLKGGLIGAGVGAGAAVLLDKPLLKTSVLGAGIGAGTQAVRYSSTLNRHPIVKDALYGSLAGAGASQLTREGSIGKGALWGAALGTGVGALRHMD